ncbi:MAG TPA: alkaline phosphatase family protein, partial [Puia sp.]|nr:alkaline phosphatase family protein [Puia sp.]
MQQKNRGYQETSMRNVVIGLFLCGLCISGCRKNDTPSFPGKGSIEDVKHIVVIYLENHSFDNLYGQFAGANGLQNANPSNITQVDSNGNPYTFLPPVSGTMAFP